MGSSRGSLPRTPSAFALITAPSSGRRTKGRRAGHERQKTNDYRSYDRQANTIGVGRLRITFSSSPIS